MKSPLAIPALLAAVLLSAACDDHQAQAAAKSDAQQSPAKEAVTDQQVAPWQQQLLQTAFAAASKLPFNPHVKNKARNQAAVVDAWLELGQPTQVARCIDEIPTWQRGMAYANLAYYLAGHGAPRTAEHDLEVASGLADDVLKDPNAQDWPRYRIRARIAATQHLLGQTEKASEMTKGMAPFELGAIESERVRTLRAEDYDDELAMLRSMVAKGDYDMILGALQTAAALYDRFFGDVNKRSELQQLVQEGYPKFPLQLRIELLLQLSRHAIAHQEPGIGLAILEIADKLLQGNNWLAQDSIPIAMKIATVRGECGDKPAATASVRAAAELYEQSKDRTVDIYRAGVLRAIAEAWQALGDHAAALAVCQQALQAGIANPNSRPRTDDLVATCCTMALRGIEPDAATSATIERIAAGLGDPW